MRQLYRLGVTSDQAREVFRLIDWMMHLRRDLEDRLTVEMKNIEQEQVMPYVTAFERYAQERGHNEGRVEGRVEGSRSTLIATALRQLKRRVGPLSDGIEARISVLPMNGLEQLVCDDIFNIENAAMLETWLQEHAVEA